MFKRRKSHEEMRKVLFESNAPAEEREEILLHLINDQAEESNNLLIEYLKYDSEVVPINPVFNYRGEFISGIKSLVINKVGKQNLIKSSEIKNLLFHLLGRYYLYSEVRESLLNVLSNEFQARDQALAIILTQASQENIPIEIYTDLIKLYLNSFSEEKRLSYLTNIILSPDFVSSDFPTKFNTNILDRVISIKGEQEGIFLLLQTLADKCTKPNKNYYQKDYLKPFHEALNYLSERMELLSTNEKHQEILSYLRKILSSVGQSEDEEFLMSYNEKKNLSDAFISSWLGQIETRSRLRKELLNLLVYLKDESAQHEMTLIEFQKKYSDLDEIKTVYKELSEITDLTDLQNMNEFIFKLEILLEILEWSFGESLETNDYTKFDIIKAILMRVNSLVQKQHPDSKTQTILNLLKTTTDEAINQYLFRQSMVQKVIKSEEFLLKQQQREVKYLKMELEPIHMLNMKFKNVRDLAEKQKKRFHQLIGNFNSILIMDFLTKINDVVMRIANLPNYYVILSPRLRVFNANYAKKDNSMIIDDLDDRLSIFYRNFEGMISASLQSPISILSYRRIDVFIDLINDFLSYNGLVDFEVQYFTASAQAE